MTVPAWVSAILGAVAGVVIYRAFRGDMMEAMAREIEEQARELEEKEDQLKNWSATISDLSRALLEAGKEADFLEELIAERNERIRHLNEALREAEYGPEGEDEPEWWDHENFGDWSWTPERRDRL